MIGEIMANLRYKGYECTVELSETRDYLIGRVLGLNKALILCEGESVSELKGDFETSIDEYLEECHVRGWEPEKPYKGSFNVRVGAERHKRLDMEAKSNGISMNKMLNHILDEHYAIEN